VSNILTQNPVRIDTAMVSGFKTLTLTSLGAFQITRIEKIYWENPVTIADNVTIINPNSGITIINLRCEVSGQAILVDWTPRPRLVADFQVSEIDSGVLWLYLM
jgi:hypothetical protein